ncbi:MAG: heme o synthase [Chloroflexi bacterium]|nr:heme o synthase [Chloroflexota bacterium]MDA1240048.1 heme o synthase [Chloroflexota bacterium]
MRTGSGPEAIDSDALAASRPAVGRLLRDYVILTKPAIMLLLLITTVPAMILAADGWPGTQLVIATLIGGMLASGGAGAVNMWIDRDIDQIMRRTQNRPIPGGRIPARHAAIFGFALGLGSGPWLYLTVNGLSALLALGAFGFYVFLYSMYLKRHTVHNTVLGGVAGAMPPLIGWAAVTDSITIAGLLLFFIVFYWQPPHFWALALALEKDYRDARIPMMPVVLGERETKRQTVLYSVLTLCVTLIFGAAGALGVIYFAVALAGGLGFCWFAVRMYRSEGLEGTRGMFRYSTLYLAALFAAMVIDRAVLG